MDWLSTRRSYRPHIYLPFLALAQRFRCASAIRLRAAELSLRLFAGALSVDVSESKSRTFCSRAISESIELTIFSSVMPGSIQGHQHFNVCAEVASPPPEPTATAGPSLLVLVTPTAAVR